MIPRCVVYQSKTIRGTKYVSYDAQLCPLIDKGQRAPNAQLAHQIVNRHHDELKSSSPDSQTLKNLV
jgi:hypothetical protein